MGHEQREQERKHRSVSIAISESLVSVASDGNTIVRGSVYIIIIYFSLIGAYSVLSKSYPERTVVLEINMRSASAPGYQAITILNYQDAKLKNRLQLCSSTSFHVNHSISPILI
jgi:hypothetical protein